MRVFVSACFVSLCATLAVAQDPAPTPAPKPEPAPEVKAPKAIALGETLPKGIKLADFDGKAHKVDDWKGKVVVLHFWSSTCPWEVVAEPKINALSKEYEKKGVVVLGIAANAGEIGEQPDAKAFEEKDAEKRPYAKLRKKATEVAINHPLLVDHGATLGKTLDAKTTPHMFVFDKEGVLVYTGALDDDGQGKNPERAANHVRNAVDAVLEGKKVEVAQTKPYG